MTPLESARTKLDAANVDLTPAEFAAMAEWKASQNPVMVPVTAAVARSRANAALVDETIALVKAAASTAEARGAVARLFEDRGVQCVIEKTWGDADFNSIKTGS